MPPTKLIKLYHELDEEAQRLQRLYDAGKLKSTADIGKYQFTKRRRNEVLDQIVTLPRYRAI